MPWPRRPRFPAARKQPHSRPAKPLRVEPLEDRSVPAVMTVTNTLASGAGSLRQAILDANVSPGADSIVFNIPASDPGHIYYKNDGVVRNVGLTATTMSGNDATITDFDPDYAHSWFRIKHGAELPTITEAVTIDGYTQPGAVANSSPGASNTVLRIEIDGTYGASNGFVVTGGSSVIRGLAILNHGYSAIRLLSGGGNQVAGNFIGRDISGWGFGYNSYYGVEINGSSNNLVGGTSLADRNVIASNNQSGVFIIDGATPATQNAVQGNFIGTGVAGSETIGNGYGGQGVLIRDASGNLIGGTAPGAGNVISGGYTNGIHIHGFMKPLGNNVVEGNLIGLDVTGTKAVRNGGVGIRIEHSDYNRIGGAAPGARNIISGNLQGSVTIFGTLGAVRGVGNVVQGNWVGFDVTGNGAIPNAGGISVSSGRNTLIGGTQPGAGNRIGNNNHGGVAIDGSFNTLVQGNVIGVALNGAAAGNTDGVTTHDSQNTIVGGYEPGAANTIRNNTLSGVGISPDIQPSSWWRAEGDAHNITANGDHGSLFNGADFAPGVYGRAFRFDGVDDYVQIPDHPALQVGEYFAIDAWILPNDVNRAQQIVSKFGPAGNDYQLGLEPGGVLRADGYNGIPMRSQPGAIVAGRWTHVAFAQEGNPRVWNLYVNGVVVATTTVASFGNGDSTTPLSFGRKGDGTQYFGGLIDEVALHNLPSINIPEIYRTGGVNKFHGASVMGNNISNNIVYQGIDLAGYGPTPNDADDLDIGANDLQNAPVITAATATATQVTVTGTLRSIPYATYEIDVFDNSPLPPGPNPTVEGEMFLGHGRVVTDANGNATFTMTFNAVIPAGHFLSATATVMGDDDSNPATPLIPVATSEFSGPSLVKTGLVVSGVSFHDLDDDGVRDPGEPGLHLWPVYVDANNNGVMDPTELRTNTDAGGGWSFANLPVGVHHIREVVSPLWYQTTPPLDVTVTSGSASFFAGAIGNYRTAAIGGAKFNDTNGNGLLDLAERPLSGWTIYLDANDSGTLDPGETSAVTDEFGNYLFDGRMPGDYRVREVQQAGWTQTSVNGVVTVLPRHSAQTFTVNVANHQDATGGGGDDGDCDCCDDSPLTVDTTLDVVDANDGLTSLREAILYANSHANALNSGGARDVITFCIPGAGPHTIAPLTQLPTITDPVVIDGYTQHGSRVNTSAVGDDAVLNVQLDGRSAVGTGLVVSGGRTTIRGLAVYGFANAIQLGAPDQPNPVGDNVVEGCFIGTDATGTVRRGNSNIGIWGINDTRIRVGTDGDGVNDPAELNVIVANASFGVFIQSAGVTLSTNDLIAGNYIGVDRTGMVTDPNGIPGDGDDLGNGFGVKIFAMSTTITGNVVSGNRFYGIHVQGTNNRGATLAEHNVLYGNLVGTDAAGTHARPNGVAGIAVEGAEFTLIGGTAAGVRNVISGNNGNGGIHLNSAFSTTVVGNYIGVDVNGGPLGNTGSAFFLGGAGIQIQGGADNHIGGTEPGQANVIAFNQGAGVMVTSTTPANGNTIRGNSVVGNVGLGIDLAYLAPGMAGITGNDAGDTDTGPNGFQNFPLLAAASSTTAGTTVTGTFNGAPLTTFTLDFYASAVADPSGYGEGQAYLGSAAVDTDVNGNAAFTVTVPGVALAGERVTATATDPAGSTSEFSGAVTVVTGVSAPSAISGSLFHDADRDGVRDAGESPAAGAIVFLDADGDGYRGPGEAFAITPADGTFTFGGLPAGTHHVREDPPSGWVVTTPPLDVTLAGGAFTGGLIGDFRLARIAGVKFDDVNGDGTAAPGEPGLPGWTIFLDANGNGALDPGEASTATDSFGAYAFDLLEAGTYVVREVQQPGWTQTSANPGAVVVFPAVSAQSYVASFGNFRLGSIDGGVTFDDGNRNGVRDPGEPGLPGRTVFLDGDDDGVLDPGEPTRVTDADGGYSFDHLPAGDYHVRVVPLPGWVQTTPPVDPAVTTSGQSAGGGAVGIYRLATISGVKFEDANGDGTRQADERGLEDWTIFLDANNNGTLDPGETSTRTGPTGAYTFGSLDAGTYTVREQQRTGWAQTTANPAPVTVLPDASGQAYLADFGNRMRPSSLSGFVWNDANDNREIDLGETAIAGVVVDLVGTDDRGTPVHLTGTTDSDGYYLFAGLRPGTYEVRETQPAGYADGGDAVGSLGGTLANDAVSQIVLAAGVDGVNYNFGERSSGTFVHHGQTATIGFWQNKNGQTLIKSLNGGGTATALGNWLAANFPNLYGAAAGANNLAGKTNAQVAAYYVGLFKAQGQKLEAQVLAAAFAVYVTDSDLAGLTARPYGFEVTTAGTGAARFNVGAGGEAFGVANNTVLSVFDVLRATDRLSSGGVLYASQRLRNLAISVYDGINQAGDI